MTDVWVKLDGFITPEPDIASTWAIGSPRPEAEATLRALAQTHRVIVYGGPLYSPKGQRAVQRWLIAHSLAHYVYTTSYEQPPKGAEVRDTWVSTTKADETKPSTSSGQESPATAPSTTPSATSALSKL
jgi:hypothetical protein